ncbi:MAG: diguanylate cyclase [Deltaproteobacteria bacterium]|nr:diguanylate cyclase [Deltaproteobacteria bacterium]MBW1978531.1 diguanylate cyclase [Deltaproteobacteria bacterium]MBW2046704.1 diguanylate cyclase [Deltaproteobacteria bacterium]MBW2301358.1 diguanylate cyclase [Deltaproteobacteria bacterium]RLB29387.1 MAG: hypothetical protein DRH11_16070 [Deltaproteobacteria bacterium]
MVEKILVVSEREEDGDLFDKILANRGFQVEVSPPSRQVETMIVEQEFAAVLADYDLIGNRAYKWIRLIQEDRSKCCIILYGEKGNGEKISEMLQAGAYGFVPRSLLPERIYDTVVGALENRKAFGEILAMIEELREVNERLELEKQALRSKNRELSFINRLSSEVSYELNWDNILPRIVNAGLPEVVDAELIAVLFRVGSEWKLAVDLLKKRANEKTLEGLKNNIIQEFSLLLGEKVPAREVALCAQKSNTASSTASSGYPAGMPCAVARGCGTQFSSAFLQEVRSSVRNSRGVCWLANCIWALTLAGKPLGAFILVPKERRPLSDAQKELISTICNILAMSLKNAQEYYRLEEMTITDGLTGVYNHKGFISLVQRELQRAKRYDKPLSLVMIDVDNFKAINDSLGHQAGDRVLQEVACCLKSSLRKTDLVARYGGDEFAILLPETETEKAEVLMKRVLHALKNHTFLWGEEKIVVGISYGISSTSDFDEKKNAQELIRKADCSLYYAKRSRNFLYPAMAKA